MKKRIIKLLVVICLLCVAAIIIAACKVEKMTVRFIVDDETYATIYTSGNEIVTIPQSPTKDGYMFDGWYWDNGTWQRPFTANSLLNEPLNANMSVYAKFLKILDDYSQTFENLAKNIESNAQTHNSLSDGMSHIYAGAYKQNSSDLSFELSLFFNEMHQGDNQIVSYLSVKDSKGYVATITLTFYQSQSNHLQGLFTDYSTKSKGEFRIEPSKYYNNSNVLFDNLTWGAGYAGLANESYPHRLSYEYLASGYTERLIMMLDNFLKSKFNYGVEKLSFENAKKSKTPDPITAIFCDESIALKVGETVNPYYIAFPCYKVQNETIKSSNNSVLSVEGKSVKGISTGTATITISAGSVSKTINVTVNPKSNADTVRDFLRNNNSKLFDADGNILNDTPETGVYYLFLGPLGTDSDNKFAIIADYKYAQPAKLDTHQYIMYFTLSNDSNVIDQIYNTATGTYSYYKNSTDKDATSLNSYILTSSGKLSFKYSETTYMKYLSSQEYIDLLNSMSEIATQTIEALGKILSKNSSGCLDTNKTPSFNLTLGEVSANSANFVCDITNYFGERIKSAMLYSGGSLVRDCTSEFSQNYALNNLDAKTSYSLEVTFAYNKNDGNGEQTVKCTVEFTTHVADNTPYTITYNANGGQVEQSSQIVKYNKPYSLLTPSWTGHQFDGWYYNGKLFDNSGTWKLDVDITLIAQWSLAVYNIHYYNITGATNNNPDTYKFGSSITINAPTKTGYTFIGWTNMFDTGTPIVNYNITATSTGALYLSANWQANEYTVTFECNGADEELSPMKIKYDAWFALPNITRVGYTFNGWYNGTSKMSNAYYKYTKDIVLSARWTANKNTPYAVEHYQQNIDDDDYTLFKTTNHTGISDANVSPAVESYTGFTSPSRQSTTISADGSLVVKYYYTRNIYTVSYVTNGGVAMEATLHKYGASLDLVNAEREGFTFGGWFTNAALTSSIQDITMSTNNINVYAWWQEETKAVEFSYTYSSTITITEYKGSLSNIHVPSFIGGTAVTTIGESAFRNNENIESVVLNEGITNIGNYSFGNCEKLLRFNSDNDGEFILPNGLKTIGYYAFYRTPLMMRVTIPDSVESLQYGIFYNCTSLEEITSPFVGETATTTSGYSRTFGHIFGNDNLTSTIKDNEYKTSEGKGTYQGYYATGNTYRYYYYYVPTSLRSVTITVQTAIPANAFHNCDLLEKITIPENVTSIGSYAFYNCSALKQLNSEVDGVLNIPASVTTISGDAFYNNKQVTKVTLGQDIKTIGNYAFGRCSALVQFNSENANELVIPNNVETIGSYAFCNFPLVTKIIVADSVTSIGAGAFQGFDALEEITLPFVGGTETATGGSRTFGHIFGDNSSTSTIKDNEYKTSEGKGTYQGYYSTGNTYRYYYYYIPTSLRKVTITAQTKILANAFHNCDLLEKITIPENVTSIGAYAFYNCQALKQLNSEVDGEFNIPINVTEINTYTFYNCDMLEKVVLGENVTSLGNVSFAGCDAINDINVKATVNISANAFNNSKLTAQTGVVYLGSLLYKYNGTMPSGYVLNVKPNTISIYNNALKGQTGLTKVILPENITSIGNSAFEGCTALVDINMPDSLETLGTRAFYNCKLLENVTLTNVATISQYAFYGCAGLQSFSVANATMVDSYALQNCAALVEVSLPKVQTIGASAFSGCVLLSKFNSEVDGQLILPNCCESVGTSAFENCKALVDVNFAKASIYSKVLANCISLEKLSVATINTYLGIAFGTTSATGLYAARQGSSSTTYYIPNTLKEVALTVQESNQIADYLFANFKSLIKVKLPNNVTTLGAYAFSGCAKLQQVVLPTGLTSIGEHCFDGCTVLTDVDLTRCSLQTINAYAFQNCSALQEIYISSNVTYIGEYVFNGCAALTISCQVAEYPYDWDYNWNPSNCEVVWSAEK